MALREDIENLILNVEKEVIPLVETGKYSDLSGYYKGVNQGLSGMVKKLKEILKENDNE